MEKQNSKETKNEIVKATTLSVSLLGLFLKQLTLNNKINKIDKIDKIDKENTEKILKRENLDLKILNDYLSYELIKSSGRRIVRNITNIYWTNPNFNNIYLQNSLNENIIKLGYLDDNDSCVKYKELVEDGFIGPKTTTALVDTINVALKKSKESLDFFELMPVPSSVKDINTRLISDEHWEKITNRKIESLVIGEKYDEIKDNLFTVSLKYALPYLVEKHREFTLDLCYFFRISGIGKDQQQGLQVI
jgi:hypothetical protein